MNASKIAARDDEGPVHLSSDIFTLAHDIIALKILKVFCNFLTDAPAQFMSLAPIHPGSAIRTSIVFLQNIFLFFILYSDSGTLYTKIFSFQIYLQFSF